MSVINKALSDLASAKQRALNDKKTHDINEQLEQNPSRPACSAPLKPAQIKKRKPSYKYLTVAMIAVGCFMLGGWAGGYVFFTPSQPAVEEISKTSEPLVSVSSLPQEESAIQTISVQHAEELGQPLDISPTHKPSPVHETEIYEEPSVIKIIEIEDKISAISSEVVHEPFVPTFDPQLKKTPPVNDQVVVKTVEKSTPFVEEPVKPENLVKPYQAPKQEPQEELFDSQMVVKTVNLSLPQLAEHSIQSAKDALEANDSARAIQAYYSALSYTPKNEFVRQQLAALLYGRKQPQKALRVLQQGIELNKNSELLRVTLSKLLVREKQPEAALAVLEYIPETASSEYIAMRGALSQQQIHSNLATESYLMLVAQEPNNGRWWLGLAISYDQAAQSSEALKAYKNALVRVGVSASSQQFVRQRIKALSAMEEKANAN